MGYRGIFRGLNTHSCVSDTLAGDILALVTLANETLADIWLEDFCGKLDSFHQNGI